MDRIGNWLPVESVSFPRSGHSLTRDLLRDYFGPEFNYDGDWPGPGIWKPGVHFQKNHDFDLDTPLLEDRKYLVQVRDPFAALLSWHQLTVRWDGIPDTRETLRQIAANKLGYWAEFTRKWVYSEDVPNRMILMYRDLVEEPAESLWRLVGFFGEEPEPNRIRDTLSRVKVIERQTGRFYL